MNKWYGPKLNSTLDNVAKIHSNLLRILVIRHTATTNLYGMWLLKLSHSKQNYLILTGWDREHFFFNTRSLLVIKRAWLLDADWLRGPALSWSPALYSSMALQRNGMTSPKKFVIVLVRSSLLLGIIRHQQSLSIASCPVHPSLTSINPCP